MSARTWHEYGKSTMLYAAKSLQSLRAAFDSSHALSLVFDEARMINAKLLQAFASSPVTYNVPQGMTLPPQMKREMHIELKAKKIDIRIDEAMLAAEKKTKSACRPKSDPLVATYDLILALDNAVKLVLPGVGLLRFRAEHTRPSLIVKRAGKYSWVRDGSVGRWQVLLVDEKGNQHRAWLLPDADAWDSDPPAVLCLTGDQDSETFAAYVHLSFHELLHLVYFSDLNHIEHNVDGGVLEAQNMSFLDDKSRHLCRLHHGPKKGEGHWHGQIKYALEVILAEIAV